MRGVRTAGLTVLAGAAIALHTAGGGAAAASSDQVRVAGCADVRQVSSVRPRAWSVSCLGGSQSVQRLRWSSYGGPRAFARGVAPISTCPDGVCAPAGIVRTYPAKFSMRRVRVCDDGARYYTRARLVVRFPPGNPFGRTAGWRLVGDYPAAFRCRA